MSLPLSLNRTSPEPLYRQVERQIRAAIDARRLRPGDRVPSVRALAAQLEVGRLTIATAYEQLAADGYLVGRIGFGTVVAPDAPPVELERPAGRRAGAPVPGVAEVAAESAAARLPVRAESTHVRYDLRPGPLGGPSMAAGAALERHFRDAWRDLADGVRGAPGELAADPAGDPLLRATIASHLRAARGGRCEPQQVVVLSGALIGVSAVARMWLGGDRLLVLEDPADPAFRRALSLGGGDSVAVPVDRHGIRTDRLPLVSAVALVSPTVQAMTGARMPLARRLRLLAWAATTGSVVIEDAQADDLALGAAAGPPLQGLDDDGRVVHVGAFASILHPGVRLGYAVVPPALVDAFTACVAALDPGATPVQQRALGRFLADGHFDRHLLRVRRALTDRHEAAVEALRRELGWLVSVEPPAGGSRIVVAIEDDAWTGRAVAEAAAEAGVAVESLAVARLATAEDRELVIDVARHEPHEIRAAVRLLAQAVRAATPRTAGAARAGLAAPWSSGSPAVPSSGSPSARRPTSAPRHWPVGGRPAVGSSSRVGPRVTAVGRGDPT